MNMNMNMNMNVYEYVQGGILGDDSNNKIQRPYIVNLQNLREKEDLRFANKPSGAHTQWWFILRLFSKTSRLGIPSSQTFKI